VIVSIHSHQQCCVADNAIKPSRISETALYMARRVLGTLLEHAVKKTTSMSPCPSLSFCRNPNTGFRELIPCLVPEIQCSQATYRKIYRRAWCARCSLLPTKVRSVATLTSESQMLPPSYAKSCRRGNSEANSTGRIVP